MLNANTSGASQPADPARPAGWKAVCISPNRGVLEELAPVLSRTLPSASISEIRAYPAPAELAQIAGSQAAALFFLDAITDQALALSLIPEIVRGGPAAQVIVLLAGGDPSLLLRCLRLGAAEFLIQPFTPDQLSAALAKVSRLLPKDRQPLQPAGKVYAVMPVKGSTGASTLAVNIACQLKRTGSGRVLLADMDPLTGTLSFLLKISSSYSFLDVLSRAEALDADLWKAMVTERHGVDVLLAPEMLLDGVNELVDASSIVEYARLSYDAVVLDTAGVYGDWSLSQARLADEVLLVTTAELPALHATQRALAYLESNHVGRWKARVLVNRYEKDASVSLDVIGTVLQTDVFHVLPSDHDAVQRALLEGKPVAPATNLGKALVKMGERLAGKEQQLEKRNSSLGSLLALFSRTTN